VVSKDTIESRSKRLILNSSTSKLGDNLGTLQDDMLGEFPLEERVLQQFESPER
jgi:hypothetical protein